MLSRITLYLHSVCINNYISFALLLTLPFALLLTLPFALLILIFALLILVIALFTLLVFAWQTCQNISQGFVFMFLHYLCKTKILSRSGTYRRAKT